MKNMVFVKKAMIGLLVAGLSVCAWAYRSTSTSTEPNVWSRNYSGVLAAAAQTGYPILIVIVNSATCGHCHILNQLTLNSAAFAKMESELTFYKLMMDAPNGGEFQTVASKYYSYFNNGMYPVIGVVRKDGSMYGAYGNWTTDERDVTAEIRSLIEKLATEQGADIWSGSGVAPAVSPAAAAAPKLTITEWAAKLKGKANGILFDANQNVAGNLTATIAQRGKVTLKMTTRNGNENIRGEMTLADNKPQVKVDDLSLTYDPQTGAWSGTWNGLTVLASTTSPKGYDGLYTAQATNAGGSKAGFLTVTLNATGKGNTVGLLNGRNKVSAVGNAVVLPAALIAANLPAWQCASDAAFIPVVKRGVFTGGMAVTKNGTAFGQITAFDDRWEARGARFAQSNLSSLSKKAIKIRMPSKTVEIGLAAKGQGIVAVANDYAARITVTVKKGTFKGNAKIDDARLSFEGVLIAEGGDVRGAGVSYGPGGVYAVALEAASAQNGSAGK